MKTTELLERFNERINQVADSRCRIKDGSVINFGAWFAFDNAKSILADIVKDEETVCEEDDLK